jgi:tetratricopeptide (TPR) repeat protein
VTRALLIACLLVVGATTADAQARRRPVPRPAPPTDPDRFDWQKAGGAKPKASAYELAMTRAERLASRALQFRSDGTARLIDEAIAAYELACAADERKAEPHYAVGQLIAVRYPRDVAQIERALRHWEEFERLAPTDPRLHDLYDQRALILTKLATPESYKKAILDYDRLLKVMDMSALSAVSLSRVLANGAEVYMMVGELETSINLFVRAMDNSKQFLAGIGLAVALDRDGQGLKAREVMRDVATDGALKSWVDDLKQGDVFYVPDGEVHYYFALIHDALGNEMLAIEQYQAFIDSGAHPQFHRRARANIDDLRKQLRSHPVKVPRIDRYGRPVRQDLTWWREASGWLGP